MKITSTWLLTSAAQVIITIAVGAFMIINAAVISFYVIDGYQNYFKKQSANVIMTAQIHRFDSVEFTDNPRGTQRQCIAVAKSNGQIEIKQKPDWTGYTPSGDFCWQLMSANNLHNWMDMAPASNGISVIEKIFWSVCFFFVFISGAVLVATIPANIIGTIAPVLSTFIKPIALLLTLPVVLFWAVFVKSAWQYHPSYWISPEGYVVSTETVFITEDDRMYKAPATVFEWTSSKTMQELMY